MIVKVKQEEIDNVLNKAVEAIDDGKSQWPGMSYEHGVEAALLWLIGDRPNPMEEE